MSPIQGGFRKLILHGLGCGVDVPVRLLLLLLALPLGVVGRGSRVVAGGDLARTGVVFPLAAAPASLEGLPPRVETFPLGRLASIGAARGLRVC